MQTAIERQPGRDLKVLLVEDNAADARLVTELLREVAPASLKLTHVGRLAQALRYLSDEGFSAVLLDLSLPDSQGLETFAQAHALAPDAPIVVLTGLRDEGVAARAVREGAQDYLVKGQVDGPMLYQSIRYAIERHHFKETLRASEARYRGLVDASIQGIVIEVDGTIRLANPAFARLLGFDHPDQCVGQQTASFVAPADQAMVAEYSRARRSGEEAPSRYECRLIGRDGALVWFDCSVTSIPWDGERATLSAMVDVTERKYAEAALQASEAQLRQAQKMQAVGRLAGGVAHDFNNLLTVITSYAELLLREFGASSQVMRTDLLEIQNAATTAATLTRQLLAFTRQQVLEPRVFALNAMVQNSENLLRRLLGEDIRIRLVLDEADPRVRADAGQLEQVLINLAVNGRDAMPEGGTLRIETTTEVVTSSRTAEGVPAEPGFYAVLRVTDNGVGMTEETRARMFEPFFTTKEIGRGTGLGLATVSGIVKQGGGFVRVESEVGRGTTLEICLPASDAAEEITPITPPPVDVGGAETLLLVEDAAAVRAVMRRALEGYGYRVVEAPDAQAALRIVNRNPDAFDLLITDAVMPGISGRRLAARLRALRPTIRVIFMSGYADDVILRTGELEPWASYLQKPFTPEVLARRVREVLRSTDG